MPTIDTAAYWLDKSTSDVIIKYGEDRKFHGHKLILARSSDYFKKLIKGGANGPYKFEESDDEEAIEAMLEFIYQDSYTSSHGPMESSWQFHLSVAIVGRKYEVVPLYEEAAKKSVSKAEEVTNTDVLNLEQVSEIFQLLPDLLDLDPCVRRLEQYLREHHFVSLLKAPEFRAVLKQKPALLEWWSSYLQRLLCDGQAGDISIAVPKVLESARAAVASCESCVGCVELAVYESFPGTLLLICQREKDYTNDIVEAVMEFVKAKTEFCGDCKGCVEWAICDTILSYTEPEQEESLMEDYQDDV